MQEALRHLSTQLRSFRKRRCPVSRRCCVTSWVVDTRTDHSTIAQQQRQINKLPSKKYNQDVQLLQLLVRCTSLADYLSGKKSSCRWLKLGSASSAMEMNFENALSEIMRQQKESMERMDSLKDQHREWQKTLEHLLSQSDSLKVPQVNSHTGKPEPLSGDVPEDMDIGPEEFRGELVALESAESPSAEVQRSSKTSRRKPRVEVTESRLQKLVDEVLMQQNTRDLDEYTEWEKKKRAVRRFINSNYFDYIAGVVICINMIMIGIEAQLSLEHGDVLWATWIERLFLLVYTVEISLRLFAGGRELFKNSWFLLDFFLVCVGFLALVVAPLIVQDDGVDGIEKVMVVRGLRLLRLARALRMIGHFKVIWRLVYGILTAGHTMLSVTFLVSLGLFIFGCVAVEIITKDADLRGNPATQSIVQNSFGSLFRSILTLLQFVTMDSLAAVYFPLIMEKPLLLIYFVPILLFISVALMNLVTAVLVEHALEFAAQEADAERSRSQEKIKAALPSLLDIFYELDTDASGCITREEIAHVPLHVIPSKLLETVSVDNMVELFELLDVDGEGSVTQTEFIEGLLNLALLEVPIWSLQTLKLLRSIRGIAREIGADIKELKRNC